LNSLWSSDKNGETALHIVAANGYLAQLPSLVVTEAALTNTYGSTNSPLEIAVWNGELDQLLDVEFTEWPDVLCDAKYDEWTEKYQELRRKQK
jgi:hypothetical protein